MNDRAAEFVLHHRDFPVRLDVNHAADFTLVGRHSDAVAVTFTLPCLAGKLNQLEFLAGLDIAYLEAN